MWLDFLDNKEGLNRIFKDQTFGERVSLQKMGFEGKDTKITLDLLEWPDAPPAKWLSQNCNTVQLTIVLGACDEVHLKSWDLTNIGDFRVNPIKGSHLLSFKFVSSMGAYFSCICGVIYLSKISAYQNA